MVDVFSRHLAGGLVLDEGDLGVAEPAGSPRRTRVVEAALAEFFGAEDAVLVRGGGTGAIRAAFFAAIAPGSQVIVHRAPVYHTTAVTAAAMGVETLPIDYNTLDGSAGAETLALEPFAASVAGALVQHSRQQMVDGYALGAVVCELRRALGDRPIITDDNYAVLKVPQIGTQAGADLATFSAFKVLGPVGVGVVVGDGRYLARVREQNRSGGCQIQGPEAMDLLRSMTAVPMLAASQAMVTREVARRLVDGEVDGVAWAVAANMEETVVLVQLEHPVAEAVCAIAVAMGAAPHPVGAESRYEMAPMFYRPSKAMLGTHPEFASTVVRVNPYRAGADQVVSLLRAALHEAEAGARPA
jgi:hypothetical protein